MEQLESRVLLSTATPVGVNLEANTDWSRAFVFVDAMKSARQFGSVSAPWDGSAPVDANGWPTTDFGAVVITINSPSLAIQDFPSIAGTYHLTATGKATVGGVASALSVTSQAYDPVTDTTTAEITVDAGATNLYLNFTDTDGGLRDVKLIRPGYAPDTTQVFTDDFVRSLAPFETLRLMDFTHTNGNLTTEWSTRTKPTDAIQTSDKGAAWEYGIALANQTQKDLWVNVPAHATDDYVTQLATLLKSELDSSLNVYVEYSNEVWNGSFEQAGWNYERAQEEAAANPEIYDYDGSNNSYFFAWRRVVRELQRVSSLFEDVYGSEAMNTSIRPVLASQVGYAYVLRDQLNFLEHVYGDPAETIYAIAGAPYINIGSLSDSPTLTVDQVIGGLQNDTAVLYDAMAKYTAMARLYGVKHLLYEAGIDLVGDTGGNFLNAKLPANYDPRMADVLRGYLTRMYADGADQLLYFQGTGAYSTFGTWGLTENVANLDGYKYSAITEFAEQARPAVDIGFKLPGPSSEGSATLNGGEFTMDRWAISGTGTTLFSPGAGSVYDYLLNTADGAPYTLVLNVASGSTNSQMQLFLDNQLITTVNVPYTGGDFVALDPIHLAAGNLPASLSPGAHNLRIKVISSGFSLRSLTFETPVKPRPSGVVARGVSTRRIDLSWKAFAGQTGVYSERSVDGSDWRQIGSVLLPGDANTDGKVDFADFVLLSNNFGNPGGWSQGNFTGADTVGFDSFILLSNNFGRVYDASAPEATSYSDVNAEPGVTYYYRVQGATAEGLSPYSLHVAGVTLPEAPAALAAVTAGSTKIDLTWSPVANAGYKIERSSGGTSEWVQIAAPASGTTTFTDTGLAPGTEYSYRIVATNASGDSAYSSVAVSRTAPAAPVNITATALSGSQVQVGWTAVHGAVSYRVEHSLDGVNWVTGGTAAAPAISFIDSGLRSNTKYSFRVFAVDIDGNVSEPSVVVSARTRNR